MLPVAIQKDNMVVTSEFIAVFNWKPPKRFNIMNSCVVLYVVTVLSMGVLVFMRAGFSWLVVFNVFIIFMLIMSFCIYYKLKPKRKIPLLLPLEATYFKLFKKSGLKKLGHMLPIYNGLDFLHPATYELLNKLYHDKRGLYTKGLLKQLKNVSEVALFISTHVPVYTYIKGKTVSELLAEAFVLASYGQFSSVHPEHILIAALKTKPSYKFYLAALLSIFENTFEFNTKKFVVTKPLLFGIKHVISDSKHKIYNIKGPKYIGKSALMYLFIKYFAHHKFSCKPNYFLVKSKKEILQIPKLSIKPRIIVVSKTLKSIPYEYLSKMQNAIVFLEDQDLKHNKYKKFVRTVRLPKPDIYDLYKLAIFWDMYKIIKKHYRVDELFKLVELSQVKHLKYPQPVRLFAMLELGDL